MKLDIVSYISILLLIIGLICEAFSLRCSCIYLTAIYILLLVMAIKRYSITHSFPIFLLCFGLFLMGRVFLDVLGIMEINHATKWQDYYLSDKTVIIVNTSMAISLIFIKIGLDGKVKVKNNGLNNKINVQVYNLTKWVIVLLIPFAITKLYFDFAQINTGSYYDLYTGLNRSPFIIRAGWFIAVLITPILLVNTLSKKKLQLFIIIFVILNFFDFLKGSRGALLRPGMFFLWYYYKFFSQKVNNVIVVSVLIVFAIVGNLLLEIRGDNEIRSAGPLGQLMYVFEGLGGSYYFNAYYIDFHEELNGIDVLYVVGPVIDGVRGFFDRDLRGQSESRLDKGYGLSHKMSSYIAPTSYLNGHGLGSSYIAETYSTAGFLSVILFSFYIGRFIKYIESNVKSSPIARIMSWYWIQALTFLPRSDLLSFIINMGFTLLLYLIISHIVATKKAFVFP